MPTFSDASLRKLNTCDLRLQQLFTEVVRHVDCTVMVGHRTQIDQEEAYRTGHSKLRWPHSKHNTNPSLAVDVAPYPIEWPGPGMDRETYARTLGNWYMFVGYVRATAEHLHINIRCGADWDGDFNVKDQNFHDLPHFEIAE